MDKYDFRTREEVAQRGENTNVWSKNSLRGRSAVWVGKEGGQGPCLGMWELLAQQATVAPGQPATRPPPL